jgi:hypothetical protein
MADCPPRLCPYGLRAHMGHMGNCCTTVSSTVCVSRRLPHTVSLSVCLSVCLSPLSVSLSLSLVLSLASSAGVEKLILQLGHLHGIRLQHIFRKHEHTTYSIDCVLLLCYKLRSLTIRANMRRRAAPFHARALARAPCRRSRTSVKVRFHPRHFL